VTSSERGAAASLCGEGEERQRLCGIGTTSRRLRRGGRISWCSCERVMRKKKTRGHQTHSEEDKVGRSRTWVGPMGHASRVRLKGSEYADPLEVD
jgi:hypothetical protein